MKRYLTAELASVRCDNVQQIQHPAALPVMLPHLHWSGDQLHAQDQHEHRYRHHVRGE